MRNTGDSDATTSTTTSSMRPGPMRIAARASCGPSRSRGFRCRLTGVAPRWNRPLRGTRSARSVMWRHLAVGHVSACERCRHCRRPNILCLGLRRRCRLATRHRAVCRLQCVAGARGRRHAVRSSDVSALTAEPAAVDRQDRAVDVVGRGGGEEHRGAAKIGGPAPAAGRDPADDAALRCGSSCSAWVLSVAM